MEGHKSTKDAHRKIPMSIGAKNVLMSVIEKPTWFEDMPRMPMALNTEKKAMLTKNNLLLFDLYSECEIIESEYLKDI